MPPEEYYRYLLTRSRTALLYRRFFLYRRLCAQLNGRVLDIGCGIGDFLRYRPNTVGVDVNPLLVEHCRRHGLEAYTIAGRPPMAFGDQSFDGVVLDNVLEHLEQPGPMLEEIRRLLTPLGRLIVGVPGVKGFAADPDHKRFYDAARLKSELGIHGFECCMVFHSPVRSRWLDQHLRQYALYAVFRRQAG